MKTLTTEQMVEIARGAIETNLDTDTCPEGEQIEDWLYDAAFAFAYEALRKAGVVNHVAMWVAGEEARKLAQP